MSRWPRKKMYAVSAERIGIIAGTMAYSRREAIKHFMGPDATATWQDFKHSGYRTVQAKIQIIREPRP